MERLLARWRGQVDAACVHASQPSSGEPSYAFLEVQKCQGPGTHGKPKLLFLVCCWPRLISSQYRPEEPRNRRPPLSFFPSPLLSFLLLSSSPFLSFYSPRPFLSLSLLSNNSPFFSLLPSLCLSCPPLSLTFFFFFATWSHYVVQALSLSFFFS